MTDDLRDEDRLAVEASVRLVDRAGGALRNATPCAGWDLGTLLEHLTVQHRGFGRAATGERTGIADWAPVPLGADPIGSYRRAADELTAALADDAVLDRPWWLPEIRADAPIPGRIAVGFHTLDYVVHSWDVAAALGLDPGLPDEVVRAVLPIAERIPDTPEARAPGRAFRPVLPGSADAPPLARLLLLVGRDPAWRAR